MDYWTLQTMADREEFRRSGAEIEQRNMMSKQMLDQQLQTNRLVDKLNTSNSLNYMNTLGGFIFKI